MLEYYIQLQHDEFAQAEAKAQQYINFSAIVFAIVGILSLQQEYLMPIQKIALLGLIVSFAIVSFFTLLALWPKSMKRALPINDKKKFRSYMDFVKTAKTLPYYESIVNSYEQVLFNNNDVVSKKMKYANWSRFGVLGQLISTLVLFASAIKWT